MGLAPLAPTFEDLKKRTVIPKIQKNGVDMSKDISSDIEQIDINHKDFNVDGIVDFKIFGCGGCGKTAVIRYSKSRCNDIIKITTIDTSGSAVDISNVESIKIKGLNGSGKYRSENIEPISNFIAEYTSQTVFKPVNVIVMAFSGGSGSTIGPLLVDEILRQGKIAVVFGIIDTDSEIDTTNALNCLRTIDNIATNRKGYIPTVLFDNNQGRAVVDRGIDVTLLNLTDILEAPYIGLDTQDRIKFLSPNTFKGVSGGVKLLCISKQPGGDWEPNLGFIIPDDNHEKIDATIIISHSEKHIQLAKRCIVTFRGYYDNEGDDVVASIGYQIPEHLITDLNANIHASKTTVEKKRTQILSEYDIGETSNNGMVL